MSRQNMTQRIRAEAASADLEAIGLHSGPRKKKGRRMSRMREPRGKLRPVRERGIGHEANRGRGRASVVIACCGACTSWLVRKRLLTDCVSVQIGDCYRIFAASRQSHHASDPVGDTVRFSDQSKSRTSQWANEIGRKCTWSDLHSPVPIHNGCVPLSCDSASR